MVWLILLAGLALTAWSGVPIGLGLALTGLALLHFVAGGAEALAVTAVWNVFTDFTFSAVPIYIFMGEILLVYDRPTVVATLAAGGTLGLLIPPSLSLLIYGATQNVSIGRLFLAGVLPGLMLAAIFMAAIYLIARRHPRLTPPGDCAVPWPRRLAGLLRIWPFAFLVFAVLGTMYLGLATATEAAALGVVAAIVVGFAWGELTLRRLWQAFYAATVVFGSIGLVVLGALVLAQSLSILGVPQQVMSAIAGLGLSKYVVLLLVIVVYLVLGCFFDGISLMLMTLPLVFPVMMGVGFDPVWTGVIITVMIEIGMLTPPVGMNLFVLVAITNGEVDLPQAARAALPFWVLMLAGVGILTLVPDIALALPNLVMGRP
jgi:C4-dicarboxylate transporter DctM subunit